MNGGLIGYVTRVIEIFVRAMAVFPTNLVESTGRFIGIYADFLSRVLFGRPDGGAPEPQSPTFDQRVSRIASRLRQSGSDAQALLDEMEVVIRDRAIRIEEARARIQKLELDEAQIRDQLEALEALKPEAVAAIRGEFDESLDERERRSSKRDFILFASGFLLSTAVSVILAFV